MRFSSHPSRRSVPYASSVASARSRGSSCTLRSRSASSAAAANALSRSTRTTTSAATLRAVGALRRCGCCSFTTPASYVTPPAASRWASRALARSMRELTPCPSDFGVNLVRSKAFAFGAAEGTEKLGLAMMLATTSFAVGRHAPTWPDEATDDDRCTRGFEVAPSPRSSSHRCSRRPRRSPSSVRACRRASSAPSPATKTCRTTIPGVGGWRTRFGALPPGGITSPRAPECASHRCLLRSASGTKADVGI